MTQPAWNDVFALFERLLEHPPEERLPELDRLDADELTRRTVREMLSAHHDEASLFDQPVVERMARQSARAREGPNAGPDDLLGSGDRDDSAAGRVLGAYRLVRRIGRGGMSTAYLAERVDGAYERDMVVKVVRSDRESAALTRRLEEERRILAGLEHPSIARLYDGGTTDEGRPYFVMEHVAGSPIDVYCASAGLGVVERLQLFRQVCEAVRSAHQKLVVHLDIKPSNILVTENGTPKLLDFGIARLLEPDPDDPRRSRAVDADGQRMLTPSFASPEQIRGEVITTAADVYSLGVLLYLLVSGRLPRKLEGGSVEEVERALAGQEPVRPSASDPSVEGARRPLLASAAVPLRRDLDAIVLKALELDPADRYPSVESLTEDIDRALEHRPIQARDEGWVDSASRFMRRNRTPVALAALFVLMVTGFAVAMAFQAQRIASERDKKARVVELIEQIFTRADPYVGQDTELTVREAIEKSLPLIERGLDEQPEVRGELLHTTGTILGNLGQHPRAVEQLEQALEVRVATLGEHHPDVASTLRRLGESRRELLDFEVAEDLTRRALAIQRANLEPRAPEIAATLIQLISIYCYRELWDAAEPLAEEVLTLTQEAEESQLLAARSAAFEYLSQVEGTRGHYAKAVEYNQRALDLSRELYGDRHPKQIVTLSNLGLRLRRAERFDEAIDAYEEALAMHRSIFGESSDDPALLNNLAAVHAVLGNYPRADTLYRRAIEVVRDQYDDEPWMVHSLTLSLARTHLEWPGPDRDPVDVERRVRDLMDRGLVGEEHWLDALSRNVLGLALSKQGRCEEAGRLLSASFTDLVGRNQRARVRQDAVERLRDHRERCGTSAGLEGLAFEAVLPSTTSVESG